MLPMMLRGIALFLALIWVCILPASALTPSTPENCIWKIFSIGYDSVTAEATQLESHTETSTSDYDSAAIHVAITEEIPTEANRALFGQNAEFKAAEGEEAAAARASTPTGRPGSPMEVPRGTNAPGSVNGRDFSGHAFDEMQADGLTPSVVENTITNGAAKAGNTAGTTVYYDSVNKVSVVVNSAGKVITASRGSLGR